MINKNFWLSKKVAVTGSSGFVGLALVKYLEKNNIEVIEISRKTGVDILNFNELVKNLKNVDYIIHTAAIDGNSEYKDKNSSYIFETNVKIVSNLLCAASRMGIKDLTLFSSAAVYQGGKSPYNESYDLIKSSNELDDGYILSKRVTELMAQEFEKKYKGKVLILRPNNIYGPNDKNNRIISLLSKNIDLEKKINIWGNGNQLMNFVFINDLIEILLKLVENGNRGIFNVSSKETIKLIDVVTLLSEIKNKKPIISFDLTKGKQENRILDTKKLDMQLKYKYTPLRTGLLQSMETN